ncbi:uncharacterized protein LOC128395808 [Panonychus citri]|uniref:uncharacterized protein LOC128395808 n=1 Tax=Panonychus citri TaxID=50023 RepID=UPI002307C3C2|nr:uncharacterized protein LOC128395808 [Panonychus citri]
MEDEEDNYSKFDEDEDDEGNHRRRRRQRPVEVTKKPSKEELQLVNFLEQLNRKLSIVTDKQKEAREKEDQPVKQKSNDLLQLISDVILNPKSKDNHDLESVKPRRSKSLPKVRRSNSLTRLEAIDNSTQLQPRKSKSLTRMQARKSSSLTRIKAKKSKSLTKLGPKRVNSLTRLEPRKSDSLKELQADISKITKMIEDFDQEVPLRRRNFFRRMRDRKRKSNWCYRNSFFIIGFTIIMSIIVWGVYSIIQDGIARQKCRNRNDTKFCF